MKPIFSRRNRENCESFIRDFPLRQTCAPATRRSPSFGGSKPERILSSVDFPHPEDPMSATNQPRSKAMSRPLKIVFLSKDRVRFFPTKEKPSAMIQLPDHQPEPKVVVSSFWGASQAVRHAQPAFRVSPRTPF